MTFIVFFGGEDYIRAMMVILLTCVSDTDFGVLQILNYLIFPNNPIRKVL